MENGKLFRTTLNNHKVATFIRIVLKCYVNICVLLLLLFVSNYLSASFLYAAMCRSDFCNVSSTKILLFVYDRQLFEGPQSNEVLLPCLWAQP